MSLLSTASRLNTANQLTTWQSACTSSIEQAKNSLNAIKAQRLAMDTNTDFTQEDKDEVDAMITKLSTLALTISTNE